MRHLIWGIALCVAMTVAVPAVQAARCEGDEYCSVCTNCSRCAYCGAGGTCGVCRGTSSGRSSSSSSSSDYSYSVPSPTRPRRSKPKARKRVSGLQVGMHSVAVQRWQEFLKRQGFYSGKTSGIFGEQTKRATANYQAAHGLTVDGIVGKETIAHARTRGFSHAPTYVPTSSTVSTYATSDEEKFPQTRTRRLTAKEVRSWSSASIRYAINEMYARHGLTFNNPEIQAQFNRRTWYTPHPERTMDDVTQMFDAIESHNVKTLVNERNRRRG